MEFFLEDVLGKLEILKICFGEEDMEIALEFKESGTPIGRRFEGV